VFGWAHEELPTGDSEPYHMFLQDGAYVTACMRQDADARAHGLPPSWMTYLAGDADEVVARTPTAGGTVLMPPIDVPGSGRMAVVAGPGGAALGVWQAGNHIGAQLVNEPVSMIWNEVNTPDMEATARFLEQTFGVETEDVPMVESGYKTFNVGGRARGGILQMTAEWEGVPPHWMTYFAVDDADASCAAVRAAGGVVSVEPFSTEYGRIAVVNDPQGAVFMVRG